MEHGAGGIGDEERGSGLDGLLGVAGRVQTLQEWLPREPGPTQRQPDVPLQRHGVQQMQDEGGVLLYAGEEQRVPRVLLAAGRAGQPLLGRARRAPVPTRAPMPPVRHPADRQAAAPPLRPQTPNQVHSLLPHFVLHLHSHSPPSPQQAFPTPSTQSPLARHQKAQSQLRPRFQTQPPTPRSRHLQALQAQL